MTTSHVINDKDRAAHERMRHFTTRTLAANAASMIALSHRDPEPMLPFQCKVCDEWCLSCEGTGVAPDERPHRPSRKVRQQQVRAEREAQRVAAALAVASLVPVPR